MRRLLAAALGGAVAQVWTDLVAYPALEAVGRSWEMGGIPFLFAQTFFAPVLGAMIAGLLQPVRIYLTALLALAVTAGLALVYASVRSNPGLSFLSATPFSIPLALWGALLVDARPGGRARKLAGFRNASYAPAFFLMLLAIFPVALRWIPGAAAGVVALAVPAAFFLWLANRNRRAGQAQPAGAPN